MKILSRYRKENDYHCIDTYIKNFNQLFDGRDPSPFMERDLDEDFSRYLILATRELAEAEKIKLVLKLPDQASPFLTAHEIETSISNYYNFEMQNSQNDLKTLFRQGQISLALGLSFLIVCYTGAYFAREYQGLFFGVVAEGFHVMGWVAMWRPINIFLYDWWPIRDRIRLMAKLQKIKVELLTDKLIQTG